MGDKAQAVNQQTALWRQSPRELTAERYEEFYKHLTLDLDKPLARVHLVTDAPVQMYAVLYVPAKRERGLLSLRTDHGLKLYSRKVLIQDYCKDLLPNHFRFVEGVVDSEDLPLNVSRETVQATRLMEKMKANLTRKLVDELERIAKEEPETYIKFWEQFGPFVKEGIATDPAGREGLLKLLRFRTSKSGEAWASLADVRRADEGRSKGHLLHPGRRSEIRDAQPAPRLFPQARPRSDLSDRDRGQLYGVGPARVTRSKPIKNVDDAGLELPPDEAPADAEPLPADQFNTLVERFRQALGDRITGVRESKLLTDSPCRLVSPENAPDRDLARVKRLLDQDFSVPKKLLEINRGHALIKNLAQLVTESARRRAD